MTDLEIFALKSWKSILQIFGLEDSVEFFPLVKPRSWQMADREKVESGKKNCCGDWHALGGDAGETGWAVQGSLSWDVRTELFPGSCFSYKQHPPGNTHPILPAGCGIWDYYQSVLRAQLSSPPALHGSWNDLMYTCTSWTGGKQPEALSSRGQESNSSTLPPCLLPSCTVLAPCDESKPSLFQQKDSIPYFTCPLPPAPALISNLTTHQVCYYHTAETILSNHPGPLVSCVVS